MELTFSKYSRLPHIIPTVLVVFAITTSFCLAPIHSTKADELKSVWELETAEIKRELKRHIKVLETNNQTDKAAAARTMLTSDGGQGPTLRSARGSSRTERIVNGVGTLRFPAAGALLRGSNRRTAGAWCSGTLVGCKTFLTAAHCIEDDPTPANYKVFFQNGGIFNVRKIHWPKDIYDFPYADIAVLKLDREVQGIRPYRINEFGTPVLGKDGQIVGFGRTGGLNLDYGIKRRGTVRTTTCSGGFADKSLICWDFDADVGAPGDDSNTCNGDSGGGLYFEATPIVAGITSGGIRSSCQAAGSNTDHSYDTNVFDYRDWVTKASAGDLGTNSCGNLPALRYGKHVKGTSSYLDEKAKRAVFTLNMSSSTGLLRIALNGQDDGEKGIDFDLFVIPGDSTRIDDAVCSEDGAGQFAFCEIANPNPGKWTVLVQRKAGEGYFQLSVTRFERNQ